MSNIAQTAWHGHVIVDPPKMQKSSSSLLVRVRVALAFLTDSLKQFVGMAPGGFTPQRMCPFCGLITSRSKALCLECGKSL